MVTCGEQTIFSALFSPAEKISILSAGETRAEIACSVGVLSRGRKLVYVCIVVTVIFAAPRRILEWGIQEEVCCDWLNAFKKSV